MWQASPGGRCPRSVPDPRRSPTVGELERSESARLFAERARHRHPHLTMGSENARAVAEICRKLDGLPLAIELAAARVGTLSVEQISEKLEDSEALDKGRPDGGAEAADAQRGAGLEPRPPLSRSRSC